MNLKQLRKSKGLTQIQAADLCGLSRKGYQNIEEGKNKKKTSTTLLYCIARLEGCPVSPSERKSLSPREIQRVAVPYCRSVGCSFIYLIEGETPTLFGDFSITAFDQLALENELEIRLGQPIGIKCFERAGKEEICAVLRHGQRLYPKKKED